MKNKGLNYIHGLSATVLGILILIFGGAVLIPIFGEKGAFLAGVPIAIVGLSITILSRTPLKEVFPFELPPVKTFIASVLLTFGVRMIGTSLSVIIGFFFDSAARSNEISSLVTKMSPFSAIMLVAVLPAICEEFFCRGFLIRCFSSVKNEKLIILITSVLFGIMHLDAYSFFYTALFGAVLAFIAIRTRSLLIPMILHFVSNAISVLAVFASANLTASTEEVTTVTLNFGQNVSFIIMYFAIGLLPLVIGYRMFTGKKVFARVTTIFLIVTAILAGLGYATMLFSTSEATDKATEVVEYQGVYDETITMKTKGEGNYVFTATFYSPKDVEIVLMKGDEVVGKSSGKGFVTLTREFELKEGDPEVYLTIKIEAEEEYQGMMSYSYRLERVNL